ncbi:MAG: SMC family ATPase [Dehalococcoidales bacterium]|nr:SMC family ATPase [Dehalococcoidales bacterium]
MIPVKLTLRNFMCYRENVPPLSFTGIHTACISGDNGNGKSALIDAMTWALWGKARAKSDVDLIYQGQPEVAVEFDFTVSGQMYRIIRKYARPKTRTGSGHPVLEFQIAADGGFHSISGNTVTQTQEKITGTLHMDYETFSNSAFLRQGHADEFTNQPPARRKEVLGSILRLSRYDELEEMAKQSTRKLESESEKLKQAIDDITMELEGKTSWEAEFIQIRNEMAKVEKQVGEQLFKLSELKRQKESLDSKQNQMKQIEKHIVESQRGLDNWLTQMGQHQLKIKEYEDTLANRQEIEKGFGQLVSSKKEDEEMGLKLARLVKMSERQSRLEKVIDQAQYLLLTDQKVAQKNINDLSLRSEILPQIKNELQQAEAQQEKLTQAEKTLEEKKLALLEMRTSITMAEATCIRLQSEIKELEEKLALLSGETGAKCPLCEQSLGEEEHRRIEMKYIADKDEKSAGLVSDQTELIKRQNELVKAEKEANQLEKQLRQERAIIQGKLSVLAKNIAEAQESTASLAEASNNLNEIERKLATRDFAVNEQQALGVLLEEIASQNYDEAKHREVKQRMVELKKWEDPQRRLAEAEKSLEAEKEALARIETIAGQLRESIEGELQQKQVLSNEMVKHIGLSDELGTAQIEYETLNMELKKGQEAVGRVKEKLAHCTELEEKKVEKEKQLREALGQSKIYGELAEAFGKKGIQALLIETAVPEIENEADRLLSRMTDNRMHIKIETQRATKKGEVAETLDINISDELGTRNYEMFSGGEAFRINFAIRIALSRLLARRAGAPLPTLIIDEGFGTQDNTGVEKLKEAINSIQADFEKILVITHIEELKDAFSTRIDVIKTTEGSTIVVN